MALTLAQMITATSQNLYTMRNWNLAAVAKCQQVIPAATNVTNTLVTRSTVGIVWSGPLTITTGGTYSGNYLSTDPAVPAITVSTSQAVTIAAGTQVAGPGNLIQAYGGVNITITGVGGFGTGASNNGAFADIVSASGGTVTVTDNYFSNCWGIRVQGLAQADSATVTVSGNFGFNIFGNIAQGAGHFIQIAKGAFPGALVQNNVCMNQPGTSDINDVISFFEAQGTSGSPIVASANILFGAYPLSPATQGYSGGGIIVDGGGGDTLSNASCYIQINNNVTISTTNYGVQIASGNNNVLDGNITVSCGLANSQPIAAQNAAVIIVNEGGQSGSVFFNNNAINTQFYWLNAKTLFNNTTTWPDCEAGGCDASNVGYGGTTPFAGSTTNEGFYLESSLVQQYFGSY